MKLFLLSLFLSLGISVGYCHNVTVTMYSSEECSNCQAEKPVLAQLYDCTVRIVDAAKSNYHLIPHITVSNGIQQVDYIGYTDRNTLQQAVEELKHE